MPRSGIFLIQKKHNSQDCVNLSTYHCREMASMSLYISTKGHVDHIEHLPKARFFAKKLMAK